MPKTLWPLNRADGFSNWGLPERHLLQRMSRSVSFRPSEIIYLPDDLIEQVFWIEHGCIRLSRVNVERQHVTLDILGPGEIFGALARAEKTSRNHTAAALCEGLMRVCSRGDFEHIVMANPELALKVIQLIGFRLRKLERRLLAPAFRSVVV